MKRLVVLAAALSLAPICQPTRTTRLGISGVWPPGATLVNGAPQASPEAWSTYWTWVSGASEHVVVHGPVATIAASIESVNANSRKPVVVVTDAPDSDDLVAYKAAITPPLATGDVLAWCIGNEIQWRTDLAVVAPRVNALAAHIRATKPGVQTCTVFQYERAKALSDAVERAALFQVDALAFTTYPGAVGNYATAASVPSAHYVPMRSIAGTKAVLVTEVGWASGPEQAAFIARLPSLLPATLTSAAWFSAYDYGAGAPIPFASMGMAGRPAEVEWRKLLAIPRQP